ncbi:MAG: CDP-alcohol phosphatidyltransferase family protein [Balneolaceae bacterium]|nr:CDP-alcohol phosphatidyltransferase family protein [Balneolaceae bacterium]
MADSSQINRKKKISQAVFTWSNLISFSRIFVAFPIIYLHYQNGMEPTWTIGGLVFYGIISDYLDGYIARKTNSISEWGKILDPVADKVLAFVLFVYAVWGGLIPLWFLLIELARDLLILTGSIYIQRQYGKVAMAVMSGKWSVNALAAYWMCAFFLPDILWPQLFFMGLSLSLMLLSFFDYLYRFIQIQKGVEFN